jgi:HK97 family phage prohead protease
MSINIERAAVSARPEDILVKLRNAPLAWLQNAAALRGVSASPAERPTWHYQPESVAKAPSVAAKPSRPQTRSLAPVIGWVAGVCCPGVSRPAHSTEDGETLPEQFTSRAMQSICEQARTGGVISLTWNHDGPEIVSSRGLDLLFRVDRTVGLEFEARLRDTPLGRKVLAEIDGRSLGVSIGFHRSKSWIVEREGVGRMRVVDDAALHHVAVLERNATLRPIYTGARAFGVKDSGPGCPMHLRQSAEAWAFRQIAAQAGVKR